MQSFLSPGGFFCLLLIISFASASPQMSTVTISPSPTTTVTVVITASASIPSNAPQFIDNATFASALLNSTNFIRQEFNASALAWNQTLADFASAYLWAMGPMNFTNGTECNFSHSGGPYGENLALGCSEVSGCVEMWAAEVSEYNYSDPNFSETTGHFTQLVWKDTTTVGCGNRLCGSRGWYIVCEYWPRGNVIGEFGEQVKRQINGSRWIKDLSRLGHLVRSIGMTLHEPAYPTSSVNLPGNDRTHLARNETEEERETGPCTKFRTSS